MHVVSFHWKGLTELNCPFLRNGIFFMYGYSLYWMTYDDTSLHLYMIHVYIYKRRKEGRHKKNSSEKLPYSHIYQWNILGRWYIFCTLGPLHQSCWTPYILCRMILVKRFYVLLVLLWSRRNWMSLTKVAFPSTRGVSKW